MRKGDEMKRFAIILLAVATAMVMALPATAKKPVPTVEYDAEITLIGSEGIATCGEPVRVVHDGIHFETWEGTNLEVTAGNLAWGDAIISGCHGPGLVELYDIDGGLTDQSVTRQPAPGYFRITLESDGSVAMLWIFDVYQSEQIVKELKKRTLWDITERTDFRMGGPYDENGDFAQAVPIACEAGEDICFTVTGQFNFVHFERGADPLFRHLTNGTRDFTFDVAFTEV